MTMTVEQIELAILSEYERGVIVDVASWVSRYPSFRDEILEYWMWLKGTPTIVAALSSALATRDPEVLEKNLKDARIAFVLGPQWLSDAVADDEAAEQAIATRLENIRMIPRGDKGRAPDAFRRASIYAWVVYSWSSGRERVTRLAAQKATYLLEQALDLGLFTQHRKQPLGPYDHTARYRDAEPIAKNKKWLIIKGTVLEPGADVTEAVKFAVRYLRDEALAKRFLEITGRLSDDELETWATVQAAALQLQNANMLVTAGGVRSLLQEIDIWRPKLRRKNFSVDAVQTALVHLARLRLIRT